MKPKNVYRSASKTKVFRAMVDAFEANDHEGATKRRMGLRGLYSIPVWIRPSVVDGNLYLFMPGVLVVYDYMEFSSTYYERRNGE